MTVERRPETSGPIRRASVATGGRRPRGSGTGARIHSAPRPSVILVREWEQQLSSSGCCGRIEGDFLHFGAEEERPFQERRSAMECAGTLYRALKERYADRVEIQVVDPRNYLSLVPMVLRDAWRHRAPPADALRALLGITVEMVLVNGRIVARNRWPEPAELFEAVDRELVPAPAPAESDTPRSPE